MKKPVRSRKEAVRGKEGTIFTVSYTHLLGKAAHSNLHMGICGEHGGDPSSVEFCNDIGLDYVSCSPFRVPVARLAAAQAAIAKKNA